MGTPVLPGKEMSKGLKERLKRCGRSYKSPVIPKRLCSDPVSPSPRTSPLNQPVPFPEVDMTAAYEQLHDKPMSTETQDLKAATRTAKIQSAQRSPSGNDVQSQGKNRDSSPTLPPDRSETKDEQSSYSGVEEPVCGHETSTKRLAENTLYFTPKRPRISQESSSPTSTPRSDINIDSSSSSSVHSGSDTRTCTPTQSVCATQKRLSQQDSDSNCTASSPCKTLSKPIEVCASSSSTSTESSSVEDLLRQRTIVLERMKQKEEQLRKLRMVKLYREKNDLQDLETLTTKWREVSQEAVQRLWDLASEPKPTLTQVVDHFQLDHEFLHYDSEEESFLDPG